MLRTSLVLFVFGAVAGVATPLSAQQFQLPASISQSQSTSAIPITIGDPVLRQQAVAANQQRQVEIKRDTQRMFQLTQELNEYLRNTSQGMMSLDAIKKAEQIEKLAKSVRAKMKQLY